MSDTRHYRPHGWSEYVGQEQMKSRIRLHIAAAIANPERPLDHILLFGPPGCGKTTLAHLIAEEYKRPIITFAKVRPDTLVHLARSVAYHVVFLDEIHRIPTSTQEDLLTMLEEGYLQVGNQQKPLRGLTFIGATTEPDKIIDPLFDRFSIKPPFDPYTLEDMGRIVYLMGKRDGLILPVDYAIALAKASGGLPRPARDLVSLLTPMMQDGKLPSLKALFKMARVTPDGLTEHHVRYLRALDDMGGERGLASLASYLRLPEGYLKDLERLLVERGFISYGPKGRRLEVMLEDVLGDEDSVVNLAS